MNFQELLKKMSVLEQSVQEKNEMEEGNEFSGELAKAKAAGKKEFKVDGKTYQVKEDAVDECGSMMSPSSMEPPKQQDSVTMNVSMNGSGPGGIRDLLNVLKDIQDGGDSEPAVELEPKGDNDLLMKKKIDSMADLIDDDFSNSVQGDPGPVTHDIDAVLPSGNDLHKEKGAYPKASGGDNAMKLADGGTFKLPPGDIKIKLESLYGEIKLREGSKHASRPGTEKRPSSAEQANKAVDRKKEVKADYEKRKAESGKKV